MLAHPKVSPVLNKIITLSSPNNYQDFLCKNPRFTSHLYLNSILEDQPGRFEPVVEEQKNLAKIFRSLKLIKKIYQNDLAFHRIRFPPSKVKYLVKRTQRVKILDLQDKQNGAKLYPARLDLWLKYGKCLKSINYQFALQMFAVMASIPIFDRIMQRCLRFLPEHRNLTIFKVRLPHSSSKTMESIFEFQRYPPSIRTFAIYQQKAEGPRRINADRMAAGFSRLKSLESLTISGVSLPHVITDMLLEKAPSLLNIKKFNIQNVEIFTFGYVFDLNKCQTFQSLEHLKIGNIDEGSPLSLTNPPMLESLDIASEVGIYGPGLISQFISHFNKSLKSLKMEFKHCYNEDTLAKVNILFSKISELEQLTSFKLKVENTASPFSWTSPKLSPEILENLKGLFLKPVKLESFEWKVPRISGPGILLDLFKLLESSQGTLRKLKIYHPTMEWEKSQEGWILGFLRRLEKIEVFYLTGFDIEERTLWADLVNCFSGMKSLRSLGIGCVTEGFTKESFTNLLSEIAKKKGLECLKIEASCFRAGTGEIEVPPLSLKEIMKANPALKEVSDNVRELLNTAGLE